GHAQNTEGRTAGLPDPQRLAGEEILESPNVLDPAELLRVGTTRGPFMRRFGAERGARWRGMLKTRKDGPRVLRTRSGWPARRSWKVQTCSTLRSCCGWGPPAVRSCEDSGRSEERGGSMINHGSATLRPESQMEILHEPAVGPPRPSPPSEGGEGES